MTMTKSRGARSANSRSVGCLRLAAGATWMLSLHACATQTLWEAAPLTGEPRVTSESNPIAGNWTGVTPTSGGWARVDVVLTASQEQLVGTARVAPLQGGRFAPWPEQEFDVRGSFDGLTSVVSLRVGKSRLQPAHRFRAVSLPMLDGVYSAARRVIAGTGGNNSFFALGRDNGEEIVDAARDAGVSPGRFTRQFADWWAPSTKDLAAWVEGASQAVEAVPRGRAAMLPFWHAFADEHFRKHFDATFDELSARQRVGIVRAIYSDRSPEGVSLRPYADAFNYGGNIGASATTVAVIALRAIRSWRERLLVSIPAQPTNAEGFERLSAFAAASTNLDRLWSSERRDFDDAVRSKMRAVAPVAARNKVEECCGSAHSYSDAVSLSGWLRQNQALVRHLSPSDTSKLSAEVMARVDDILKPKVQEDVEALNRVSRGLAGLRETKGWHDRFMRRYGFVKSRPFIRVALEVLAARRSVALAQASAELERRVAATRSMAELRQLQAAYLGVPSDVESAAGRRAVDWVRSRDLEYRIAADGERAIAKLAGAGLFELLARSNIEDENHVGAVIAVLIRDGLLSSAVGEFRSLSRRERADLEVVLRELLNGNLDPAKITSELVQSRILDEVRRDSPDAAMALSIAKFLVGFHSKVHSKSQEN